MTVYNPKTDTLYERGDDFKVIEGQYRNPRYPLINRWVITEKVDGTSVILHNRTNEPNSYSGRTAKTQFNGHVKLFLDAAVATLMLNFDCDIYAELAGPSIQGNPHELETLRLFVFDVRIGGFWLDHSNVRDIASKAGLETVMYYGTWGIQDAVDRMVKDDRYGLGGYVEGIVAVTDPYLYDNQGRRIRWKLKKKDFRYI